MSYPWKNYSPSKVIPKRDHSSNTFLSTSKSLDFDLRISLSDADNTASPSGWALSNPVSVSWNGAELSPLR
jgi:hypothetical protein